MTERHSISGQVVIFTVLLTAAIFLGFYIIVSLQEKMLSQFLSKKEPAVEKMSSTYVVNCNVDNVQWDVHQEIAYVRIRVRNNGDKTITRSMVLVEVLDEKKAPVHSECVEEKALIFPGSARQILVKIVFPREGRHIRAELKWVTLPSW